MILDITALRKPTSGSSEGRWRGALCGAVSFVAVTSLLRSVLRDVDIETPGKLLGALFALSLFLGSADGADGRSPSRCSSETSATWSVQIRHTSSCRIPELVHRAGDDSGDQR